MVTTITKTIKLSGGDYSQPQDAWNDIPAIVGSADLVAADSAVEFLMDSGTYESFDCDLTDGLTTDATRNVTFKAAEGQDHAGSVSGGVRIEVPEGFATPAIIVRQDYCAFEGLTIVARQGYNANYGIWGVYSEGITIKRCIIMADGSYNIVMQSNATALAATSVIENVLAIGDGTASDRYIDLRGSTSATGHVQYRMVNCSGFESNAFIRVGTDGASGSIVSVEMHNNFAGNCTNAYQTAGAATLNISGSGNIGGSRSPFPEAIRAKDQTWDITIDTSAASNGNTAIYSSQTYQLTTAGGNDALDAGTGPDSNSDVPSSDIHQHPRWGATTQVGAFQSLYHVWTTMNSSKRIDLDGIVKCGNGTINLVYDTLSVTGATGSDNTPALPVGTNAVWVQILEQTTASSDWDIYVEIDASTSVPLVSLGGSSVDDDNTLLGLWKQALEVETSDGTYPRIKATISNAGASDVSTLRVHAIGSTEGPVWS